MQIAIFPPHKTIHLFNKLEWFFRNRPVCIYVCSEMARKKAKKKKNNKNCFNKTWQIHTPWFIAEGLICRETDAARCFPTLGPLIY